MLSSAVFTSSKRPVPCRPSSSYRARAGPARRSTWLAPSSDRAERLAVALRLGEGSQVVPYLNRLSDLCWLLARAEEREHLTSRGGSVRTRRARA